MTLLAPPAPEEPPVCDYCDEGDTPVDGFHLVYTDEYDIFGVAKVPCPRA